MARCSALSSRNTPYDGRAPHSVAGGGARMVHTWTSSAEAVAYRTVISTDGSRECECQPAVVSQLATARRSPSAVPVIGTGTYRTDCDATADTPANAWNFFVAGTFSGVSGGASQRRVNAVSVGAADSSYLHASNCAVTRPIFASSSAVLFASAAALALASCGAGSLRTASAAKSSARLAPVAGSHHDWWVYWQQHNEQTHAAVLLAPARASVGVSVGHRT
jgi:hypothetical protein